MAHRKTDPFYETLKNNRLDYMLYFNRLYELAISMFEWVNLPSEIDERFLEMTLFTDGQAIFFKDEVVGFCALQVAAGGPLNLYRIPVERRAYADNGYSRNLTEKDSVIIWNNLLHTNSVLPIIDYSQKLWDLDRSVVVNAKAQKTPMLIACDEKERLSLKNVYMKYEGNEPFIFGYKGIDKDAIQTLRTDAPFVAADLYQLKMQIWNEALTYLGISNNNTQKKERMITDEVVRNMGGTIASRYSRLTPRKNACKAINEMFGLNIDCRFREDFREMDGEYMLTGETGNNETSTLVTQVTEDKGE